MIAFRKGFVLVACALVAYNGTLRAASFFDPKTKVNINYSAEWQMAPTQNSTVLRLIREDQPATISISSYNFSNIVSISDFRNHIQKTNFVGWDTLSDRKGSQFENGSASVDASWECVNMKRGKSGSPLVTVQFYYLISGRKGVIVSMTTDIKTWKAVQSQFRVMLNSFWIGEGTRPVVAKPINEADGWETPGYSIQNRNFVRSVIPAGGSKSVFWKFFVPKSLGPNPLFPQPLFLPSAVIVGYGTSVSAFAPYDGRVKWTENLHEPILGNPMASGKTVLVVSSATSNTLTALSVDSGAAIYRKRLETADPVQLAVLGSTVILASQKQIMAIDKDSGKDKWTVQIPVSLSLPVVGTAGVFIVLDNAQNDLVAIQIETGKELWRKSLAETILIPPSIIQNTLLVTAGDPNRAASFYAFNINSGALLWSRKMPATMSLISEISADNGRFYVPVQETMEPLLAGSLEQGNDDGDLAARFDILAYDVKTGVKLWSFQIPADHLLLPVRGVVAPNKLFLLTTSMDKSAHEIVNLLQLDTDKPIPVFYPMIPFGEGAQPKGFTAFQMLEHRIVLQYQDPVSALLLLQ